MAKTTMHQCMLVTSFVVLNLDESTIPFWPSPSGAEAPFPDSNPKLFPPWTEINRFKHQTPNHNGQKLGRMTL
jgi:hypothetical protein